MNLFKIKTYNSAVKRTLVRKKLPVTGLSFMLTANESYSLSLQGCQMAFFETKNPNLGSFGGPCNGKCWYILWIFGLILQPFDTF
jgi:hypothetical protein